MSHGWLLSDAWNARALPWKLPRIVVGTPMRASSSSIARVACDSETSGGRLNEIVDATNWPWWLTPSAVLVGPKEANSDSGTCVPLVELTYTVCSASGDCQNSGAASITTWYWFNCA